MIPTAKNLQQAISHFLISEGMIKCEYKKHSKVCASLKEANEFYRNPPKKTRNKVRPIKTK